ncbi:MAG: hypothetical protein IPN67_06275 [Bacteroidales bacterium]|nr:hypothetical protein [Bacteroidales bacterium]MBK8881995.1 hypothetical protein [Bacteroidales bacterium]
MRLFFCLLFIFIFKLSYSNEKPDSTRAKFVFNGNVSLNSNGMAPIPSFSLGKPALIAAFTLQKRRFSFDPQIAFSLNMKPWIIDNWLHYRLIYKPKFELRTGVDFSMFFSEYNTGEYKILKGEQYIAFEVAGIIKFSPKSILSLMYWSDNGQDQGTIRGNFFNSIYERNDIEIGRSVLFAASLQMFYVAYTGKNDGLFVTPRVALSVRNIPLSLFIQATQTIKSNIEPNPGFRWNAGMAYIF